MDNYVKDLLDKVKNTAGNVGAAAGEAARQASKQAGDFFDIAKLNLKIFDLSGEVTPLLKEIGQMVYDTHTGLQVDEEDLQRKLEIIDEKKARISELQAQVAELKNSQTCDGCGTACHKGDAFCKSCGNAL